MSVISVILVGIALSMDALGVTLSIGVQRGVKRRAKYSYILSFGFFSFINIYRWDSWRYSK